MSAIATAIINISIEGP
jgi:hypothetical protein